MILRADNHGIVSGSWEGITEIGDEAFFSCTRLQSLALPGGITRVGENAFFACINLQSLVLPDSVTEIESLAFENCHNLQSIFIPSCDDATRARIIALLPEELRSKVVTAGLLEEVLTIRDAQLQRILQTAHTNPMGRSAKNGLPFPEDVLKEMNNFLGKDNAFVRKASRQIEALVLPADEKGLTDYKQKVQVIVDEAIARSKRGLFSPVMPKVLSHLKRLEDKVSDLTKRGELEP